MSDGEDIEGPVDEATAADAGLARLLERLSSRYSFDFREYKRTSLARRIRIRMQPCDAGYPGKIPTCIPTPSPVRRINHLIGAPT